MKTLRMYFNKRSDMLCFLHTMLGYCSSGTILRNVNFIVNYECYGNNVIYRVKCANEFLTWTFKVNVGENISLLFNYKNEESELAESVIKYIVPEVKKLLVNSYKLKLKQGDDYIWKRDSK